MSLFDSFFKRYNYENTRQYKRLPATWPVKLLQVPAMEGPYMLTTKDISAGGVSLSSQREVPLNSFIEMEILIPPIQKTIRAVGKVLRCSPVGKGGGFDLGVQFEEIEPEQQTLLNQAIESFYRDKAMAPHKRRWWRKVP